MQHKSSTVNKEGGEKMEDIKKLAGYVMGDIEKIREGCTVPKDRVGIEIMALNALCNVKKTLKSKCQCEDQHLQG